MFSPDLINILSFLNTHDERFVFVLSKTQIMYIYVITHGKYISRTH